MAALSNALRPNHRQWGRSGAPLQIRLQMCVFGSPQINSIIRIELSVRIKSLPQPQSSLGAGLAPGFAEVLTPMVQLRVF